MDYSYTTTTTVDSNSNALAALFGASFATVLILSIMAAIFSIIVIWAIFEKAGEAGWKSLIPFYSSYILFKITFGNGWFFLLLLVPIVNIILIFVLFYKLSKVFGHGFGYFIGIIFLPLIFLAIIAFGSSQYNLEYNK